MGTNKNPVNIASTGLINYGREKFISSEPVRRSVNEGGSSSSSLQKNWIVAYRNKFHSKDYLH